MKKENKKNSKINNKKEITNSKSNKNLEIDHEVGYTTEDELDNNISDCR